MFAENFHLYGVRKVWRQLQREGFDVARCTVARLMRDMGLQGVIRGKSVRTTVNQRRLAPSTRSTAVPCFGAEYAVAIEFYLRLHLGRLCLCGLRDQCLCRRIVGSRVSRTAHAGFVLDVLEQALHERQPLRGGGLNHDSDRGVQYVSIRYTERRSEAGIEPPMGSVGDSYDNAYAETINGL